MSTVLERTPQTPPGRGDADGSAASRRVQARAAAWLAQHSITLLRISLGVVFLLFGALKLFPGVSPAEDIAVRTVEALTFGIVSGQAALLLTAVVEVAVGLSLTTGRFLRAGLVLLGVSLVGIMSPLVLFFADLFPGAPTLTAQYVMKDVILAAAGLVVAARALGARFVAEDASA
ncbi:MAG TPA: DoxX family membrane protein [Egibacteraceae bacterium]